MVLIKEQPPNSLDLNVLDLGVFWVLQSHQFCNAPKDTSELIIQTKLTFNTFSAARLDNVWLTLQTCMNQIIKKDGGNDYKLVHMNKKIGMQRTTP